MIVSARLRAIVLFARARPSPAGNIPATLSACSPARTIRPAISAVSRTSFERPMLVAARGEDGPAFFLAGFLVRDGVDAGELAEQLGDRAAEAARPHRQ